jgi:predicted permease
LAFAGAGAVNALFILLPYLLRRRFRLDAVEQASLSYPNCGNLIVPLVAATLGADQQIYSCAYIVIQTALLFTHGLSLIRGERRPDLKGALRNPNILAILLGAALFALHVRFPAPLAAAVNGFAGMVAPASMLVIGMAIGRADLRRIFTSRRVYAVTFLRLLALPALAVLLLRLTGLARLLPEGRDILRVVVMAASASPATTLTQMAQCYGGDAAEASALNVMGVVFLIVTMPLLLLFYQALI